MDEQRRLRVYEQFNRQTQALISSLRSVTSCDTHAHIVYGRGDRPGLVQEYITQFENDVFTPVLRPMEKLNALCQRMRSATSVSGMDAVVMEWIGMREHIEESMDNSAAWQWGRAMEFRFTGVKKTDRAVIDAHIQFERVGRFLKHWVDHLDSPMKDLRLVASKTRAYEGARHVRADYTLN